MVLREKCNINCSLDRSCVLLYVDDNDDDVVLVEVTLDHAAIPFRLRPFDNIVAAAAYLKGQGGFADRAVHPLPSVILLGHQFAGCTGAHALPELKKLPGCDKLPWIIFSGTLSPAQIGDTYRAGADHFISKPINHVRLALILTTLYGCISASPPCFLALRALEEYRGSSPPEPQASFSS